LNQRVLTETGNTETKRSLAINNFRVNLNKPLSKFEKYDTMNETRRIALFSNFYLPIEFTRITNREQTYKSITLTEQQAIDGAVERILEELLRNIENEERIMNKQINTYHGLRIYRSRSDNRSD